ncbi:MAG TPA: hypothetical protein VES73_05685 [Lamprocystis sp. (in: g-proteobacteria)]|nr:hypothetical protein [Lamprocystis sp. (in: g-proteobacteria)]
MFALSVSAGVLTAEPVQAQESVQDPAWPCDQALVPQIAAAVVWDGPPVDGLAWRNSEQVVALVGQVAPPATTEAAATAAITAFAAGLPTQNKERMLTLAFAGILEVLNRDRQVLMDGIKRYSLDQTRRAAALGEELDQLVRLEQDPSPTAAEQREALKKRMTLAERAFDEREKSFPYLCTRPVVVEQRLGLLARTIAALIGDTGEHGPSVP